MKCEHCRKEEAEIHIRQTSAGQTREFHLCHGCACKLAAEGVIPDFSFGAPASLLGSLWKSPLSKEPKDQGDSTSICPSCSMNLDAFRRTATLGCPRCYEAFREAVEPFLRKVQGATVHRGLRPDREASPDESDVDSLRRRLARAVADERYEQAAELRDRIRSLCDRPGEPS